MTDYNDQTVEELRKQASDRNLEGRSGLNKDELVAALEKSDSSGDSNQELAGPADAGDTPEEVEETLPEAVQGDERDQAAEEHAAVTHHTEASDPDNPEVVDNLSPEGQDALEELDPDSVAAHEADLALDASGPLHLQSPSERVQAGAINEEHGKEIAAKVGKLPDDFVGNILEDGSLVGVDEAKYVDPQDVIDFPPPIQPGREAREDVQTRDERGVGLAHQTRAAAEAYPDEGPTVAAPRLYEQRGQLYTDGLSGQADHNTAMAYRQPDLRGGVFSVRQEDETPQQKEQRLIEEERTGENQD